MPARWPEWTADPSALAALGWGPGSISAPVVRAEVPRWILQGPSLRLLREAFEAAEESPLASKKAWSEGDPVARSWVYLRESEGRVLSSLRSIVRALEALRRTLCAYDAYCASRDDRSAWHDVDPLADLWADLAGVHPFGPLGFDISLFREADEVEHVLSRYRRPDEPEPDRVFREAVEDAASHWVRERDSKADAARRAVADEHVARFLLEAAKSGSMRPSKQDFDVYPFNAGPMHRVAGTLAMVMIENGVSPGVSSRDVRGWGTTAPYAPEDVGPNAFVRDPDGDVEAGVAPGGFKRRAEWLPDPSPVEKRRRALRAGRLIPYGMVRGYFRRQRPDEAHRDGGPPARPPCAVAVGGEVALGGGHRGGAQSRTGWPCHSPQKR